MSFNRNERSIRNSKIRLIAFLFGTLILLFSFFNLVIWIYKFVNTPTFEEAKRSYLYHCPEIFDHPAYINALALTALVFAIFFFRVAAKEDQLRFLSIIGIMGNLVFIGLSVWFLA